MLIIKKMRGSGEENILQKKKDKEKRIEEIEKMDDEKGIRQEEMKEREEEI